MYDTFSRINDLNDTSTLNELNTCSLDFHIFAINTFMDDEKN